MSIVLVRCGTHMAEGSQAETEIEVGQRLSTESPRIPLKSEHHATLQEKQSTRKTIHIGSLRQAGRTLSEPTPLLDAITLPALLKRTRTSWLGNL
jgi:hypothetical protein